MATYQDVEDAVKNNLGGRNNTETLAMMKVAYNAILNAITTKYEWPELETSTTKTLTIGDNTYDIASGWSLTDVRKIVSLSINDGSTSFYPPLKYIQPHVYDKKYRSAEPTSSRIPTLFTMYNNVVYLFPVPDKAYTMVVKYVKRATRAAAGSTTIQIDQLLEPLILGTTGLTWLFLEEFKQAEVYLKLADGMFKVFGVDLSHFLNFEASTHEDVDGPSQAPWSDPFVRG